MKVWIGFHSKIGIVIFDPLLQSRVDRTQVRLWDLSKQKLKLFHKDTVRQGLWSLKSYLISIGLEPLVANHGIAGQIAKRYFERRPDAVGGEDDWIDWTETQDWRDADSDDESHLLRAELSEEQDAWARSEEEGWFYEE